MAKLPSGRGFRNPLRLAPIRSPQSVQLDGQTTKGGVQLPPFVRFDRFLAGLDFRQGEHITLVGPTGSGKTVLARQLIGFREYVAVLGTKNRDPELYGPLQREGYKLTQHFDPEPELGEHKIIFRPALAAPTAEARAVQREAFRKMLVEVFLAGRWCVYADEIRYLTDNLKLSTEFETLWLQGRSLECSLVCSTQNPVSIPLLAFDMATHLFLFRNTDRYRVERMSEFTGENSDVARFTIPRLPRFEFLYVDTRRGTMIRSKVIL